MFSHSYKMETEVICLSSDSGESDSLNENKKNANVANSTDKNDDVIFVPTKTEISNEKRKGKVIKRKISQLYDKDSIFNNMESKNKLCKKSDASKNMSKIDKSNFATTDNILQSNMDQKVPLPNLIIKEKKGIAYIEQDIFPLFISLCLQKSHDNDMIKIVNKLKRCHERLDPTYASSKNFALFLNKKRMDIMNSDKKLYIHIHEVMNEMKSRCKTKSQISENNEAYDAVPSTSYATNTSSINNVIALQDEDNDENIEDSIVLSLKTKTKIRVLSKAMRKCESIIKKLEEAEVDFDDENNSNYIKVERYKERMVELYNKYCELTGENADAGRAYLRPKNISTTQIVSVDQAITNFINYKISKRSQLKKRGTFTDDLIFPDYRDILECVSRCNNKKNLGLDKRKQEQLAKKAFAELGEYLQRARQNDYWDTFSLYLENTEEDPALKDKVLAKKLIDNRNEGDKRLAAIFEKYTKKQEKIGEQTDDEITTDEENSEESSIDDEQKNNSSTSSLNNEDSDNDVVEMVEENKSSVEKTKNNINTVDRDITEVMPNKTEADTSHEKCNEEVEIKICAKENVTVVNDENKIINNENIRKPVITKIVNLKKINNNHTDLKPQEDVLTTRIINCTNIENNTIRKEIVRENIRKPVITNIVNLKKIDTTNQDPKAQESLTGITNCTETENKIVLKINDEKIYKPVITNAANLKSINIINKDQKVQEDSLTTCTTNCTNTVNMIEENIDEVMAEDEPKVITCPLAEIEDGIEVLTDNMTNLVTEQVTEEIMEDNVALVETTEITTSSDKQQGEDEKKPLLRVRSFAKPPTTWEDSQHKADNKPVEKNISKVTNEAKDIIDLVNDAYPDTNKSRVVLTKYTIQFENKLVPVVKSKLQKVVPSGSYLRNFKDIINNYLEVDTSKRKLGVSVNNVKRSSIIQIPSVQTVSVRQNTQPQNTGGVIKRDVSNIISKKIFIKQDNVKKVNAKVPTEQLTKQMMNEQYSSSKFQ